MSGVWSRARRLLPFLLVAAALGFIGRTLFVHSRDLAQFDWNVRIGLLGASVLAHVGVLAYGVFVWSRVLRFFAVPDARFSSLLRIWALSSAARYIPGAVWQFFVAARLAGSSGLPQVVTLTSMLVHILFTLTAAMVVAVISLPLAALGLSRELSWTLRIAVPCVAVAATHPRLINGALALVPRALHKEVLGWHGRWLDGIGLLVLALVSWGLYGVAFFLFLLSLAPQPLSALSTATGVNALSFAAAYVVVPAPGGLGIRESAMTFLLTPLLPVGVAALISVAARLWSIVAELGLVAVALVARDGPRATPNR